MRNSLNTKCIFIVCPLTILQDFSCQTFKFKLILVITHLPSDYFIEFSFGQSWSKDPIWSVIWQIYLMDFKIKFKFYENEETRLDCFNQDCFNQLDWPDLNISHVGWTMAPAYKQRYYTPGEVGQHSSSKDLWVSFLGKVYNLTPLANKYTGSSRSCFTLSWNTQLNRKCELPYSRYLHSMYYNSSTDVNKFSE